MVKNVSKGSTSLYSWAEYESPWASTCFFSSVQWLSRVWLFATPGTAARQASLSITNSQSLLKLASSPLFIILLHRVLLVACAIYLPHQGSSPSPPCIGSTESQPLDYQGSHGLILTFYLANVVDRRVDPSYFTLYFCDYGWLARFCLVVI